MSTASTSDTRTAGNIPEAPPNPCTIINDYAKTLVTLGGALLAVTATFGGQLIGRQLGQFSKWLLVLSLIALVLVVFSGLRMQSFLSAHLRGVAPAAFNACMRWATFSFYFLGLAGASFVALGAVEVFASTPTGPAGAFHRATEYLNQTGEFPAAKPWMLRSMNAMTAGYVMDLEDGSTPPIRATVTIGATDERVVSYLRH